MNFQFSPRWVHKFEDGKVKSLICKEEADFKVLIQGGYTDSPKAAVKKEKHPAYEFYFDEKGTENEIVKDSDVKVDLSVIEVEALSWPKLKAYAKKLEGVFNTEIIGKNTKQKDVIAKIKELRDANSAIADK